MSSLRKGHLGWDLKHKEPFGNMGWLFIIINNKQSIIYITLLASISSRRNNACKILRMKSRCHLKNRKRWMGKNPLRRVERAETGKGVRFCKGLWMVWRYLGNGKPLNRFYFLKYPSACYRWLKWQKLANCGNLGWGWINEGEAGVGGDFQTSGLGDWVGGGAVHQDKECRRRIRFWRALLHFCSGHLWDVQVKICTESWIYGFAAQENNLGWRFRFINHLLI